MRIKYLMIAALAVSACVAGCARYAPQPAPPSRLMLDIELITAQPISNDFYYYIAMNTAVGATAGPYEVLTGADRARNWTYYIVYHNGVFEELTLNSPADASLFPSRFDNTSERYYEAQAADKRIYVGVYLDKLAPSARNIYFNFITSRNAITDDLEVIPPIDYLLPPYFSMNNSRYPLTVTNGNFATISTHSPSAEADKPADIVAWTAAIYAR